MNEIIELQILQLSKMIKNITVEEIKWFIDLDIKQRKKIISSKKEKSSIPKEIFTELIEYSLTTPSCGSTSRFYNENIQKWEENNIEEKTEVYFHQIIKKGTLKDFFESFNCDLDLLCLSQSQIDSFIDIFSKDFDEQRNLPRNFIFLFLRKRRRIYVVVTCTVYKYWNDKMEHGHIKYNHFSTGNLWSPAHNIRILVIPKK